MIKNNRSYFKAVLKSEQGEILADGTAAVNVVERSVTFKSSFVPLYPIGTPMEVFRIHDEEEIHRFSGKVYLSDKRLMRIVSVMDELLPGSEFCYCANMNFAATVSPCFTLETKERRFFRKQKPKELELPRNISAHIIEITERHLVFQFEMLSSAPTSANFWEQKSPLSDVRVKNGHRFLIQSDSRLPLKETEVEVVELFYFGESPSYRCIFVDQPLVEHIQLKDFLWQYNISCNKLFW